MRQPAPVPTARPYLLPVGLARMLRVAAMVVMATTSLLGGSAIRAEHGPDFELACPISHADIVLDPGHGGSDPGAIYEPTGLTEASLTLKIATIAAEILQNQHGFSVALTRTDDQTERGNSERGEFANACTAIVFVEIHLNGAADPSVNYTKAFWGEKEKDLAFSLMMSNALGGLGIPVSPVERFDNGGLLRAKMPAVLVEGVFLTNPGEAEALQQDGRVREIAEALVIGIVAWPGLNRAS